MGCLFSCIDCCVQPFYRNNQQLRPKTPIANSPALLNTPLNKVSILSSHNSFLHTLQVASVSSTRGIDIALKKGARCIELDLFREEGKPTEIYVAHGQEKTPDIIGTTKMPLQDALEFIAANAFATTYDPLFIALQINCHREQAACDTIAYMLRTYFGDRLYKGRINPNILLKDLVGKIVLIHSGGMGDELLGTVNEEWGSTFQNAPYTIGVDSLAIGSSAVRIYPTGRSSDILSTNYDAMPMLRAGATFVAMNLCTNDEHLATYEAYFADSSFVVRATMS
jgi:hypothetical protein